MSLSRFGMKTSSLALVVCVGMGLSLSACQVRPLYSSSSISGQSLSNELSSVEVAPATTRIEQEVRNNLVFALTGGDTPALPEYRLVLHVSKSSSNLSIESGTGLATTTRVSVTATYELYGLENLLTNQETVEENKAGETDVGKPQKPVTTGSSYFTASYARSVQRFANDRAQIDAENRAAAQVANDIQLRLSAFFAAGT